MATSFLVIYHYCFIQGAIIAFFAPFYLLYIYHHKRSNKTNNLTLSQHLEQFFISKQANYLVFFWAGLEASIWFVIPEYLLLLLVFLRIQKKVQLLTYDIYGTVFGTLLTFFLPVHTADIVRIPYIQPNMIKQVEVWYSHLGIVGLVFQPFSGVPYKVFTFTASRFHFFFLSFLVVAVVVRIARYYFFYFIFTHIYPFLHRFVYKNYVPLFFIAGFVFTLALLRVYDIYGEQYQVSYAFIERLKLLK